MNIILVSEITLDVILQNSGINMEEYNKLPLLMQAKVARYIYGQLKDSHPIIDCRVIHSLMF